MRFPLEDECTDTVILDQWHALAAIPEIVVGKVQRTHLLGVPVSYSVDPEAGPVAWRTDPRLGHGAAVAVSDDLDWLPIRSSYGYLWTSVGSPPAEVFAIPETEEPDRRTLNAATVGIAVSAPRAMENFLDLAHFPYVHANVLGQEPHTEVADYNIEMRGNELWAVGCKFYQPQAAAASGGGVMAEYLYRVPSPYCAMLYKSCPSDETRLDAIGIFLHAVTEEFVRAHLFLSLIDEVNTDTVIRRFQQGIISEDKPILENQFPKRLPLDPRAETPIRADKTSIAYRRWLGALGVTYGVIPA